MKILGVVWFTQAPITPHFNCFGIVYGEDAITKERKAYIGTASGQNEETDVMDISELGAKLLPAQIKEIYDFLNQPVKESES